MCLLSCTIPIFDFICFRRLNVLFELHKTNDDPANNEACVVVAATLGSPAAAAGLAALSRMAERERSSTVKLVLLRSGDSFCVDALLGRTTFVDAAARASLDDVDWICVEQGHAGDVVRVHQNAVSVLFELVSLPGACGSEGVFEDSSVDFEQFFSFVFLTPQRASCRRSSCRLIASLAVCAVDAS